MIHDLTASELGAIMHSLARLEDSDELPSALNWNALANRIPQAVSWALVALGNKKLSAAFRKEYRRVIRSKPAAWAAKWDAQIEEARAPKIDTLPLPPGSFFLRAKVTLEQPLMTRDDRQFTVSDNAVRKDRLSGRPYIAASSWKGAFRGALYQMGLDTKKTRSEFDRIWGTAQEGDEGVETNADGDKVSRGRAGRLNFYPTYFQRVEFRMLNPQDRVQRAGTVPVELEVVPPGDSGWLQLLYVPFDKPGGEAVTEASTDWGQIIGPALHAMLRRTGFGAKISLGFGVMKDEVESGTLAAVDRERVWRSEAFRQLSLLPGMRLPGATEKRA